jgi:hypothetical protein
MLTYVTGFCFLQEAETFVALPHLDTDKGVNFASEVELL